MTEPLNPNDEYLRISEEAPARAVELPKPEDAPKTLSQAMDDATDLTDMQLAVARLFPKDIKPSDIVIGRVAPEAFMSLLQLMISNDIMTSDPRKEINT